MLIPWEFIGKGREEDLVPRMGEIGSTFSLRVSSISEELDDSATNIRSFWRSGEFVAASNASLPTSAQASLVSGCDFLRFFTWLMVVFRSSSAKSRRATGGELDDMVF